MRKWALLAGRVAVTLLVVGLAVAGGRWLWVRYNVEPWTRDGRIRADVVQVSPDVNGLVTEVRVKNDQTVAAGDILFVLDRPRYELALRQAEATVISTEVALAQARRESARNQRLTEI